MSDQLTLAAETRDRAGKGASRALRRDGRVPAVIYGQNKTPESIHLEEKALVRALGTGHFMNTIVMINGQRTLPKDVAVHPVTERPLHVDFLRIAANATVTVAVPVVFRDEKDAPGLKKGGVLNIVRHELELVCDASNIPTEIEISLKGRDIGDTVHISDVTLPKGTESAIDDRDFTIATLIAPSAMKAEAALDEAEDAALAEAQAEEHAEEVAAEEAAETEAEADDAEGEAKGE